MKILFYCPLKSPDSPVPSGDREFARSLQSFFIEQGHDVYLVSRFRARLFYRRPGGWLQWIVALIGTFFKTLWYQPDVIFVYHAYYKCPDTLGWIMARLFKKPYFLFEASYAEGPRDRKEDIWGYRFNRASLETATRLYANIRADVPGLLKIVAEEKIMVITPSLSLHEWGDLEALRRGYLARMSEPEILRLRLRTTGAPLEIATRDTAQIVCVAMLRRDRKSEGVRFLIESLKDLKEQGYQFTYHHVGGGDCFEEIKSLCEKYQLSFHMYGSLPAAQVKEVLSIGDFFAFPGIDEGLGLAYLEAQAAGLPCVAFDNGGIPEVVLQGRTGFLTEPFNQQAYTESLRKLLDNPSLTQQMGQNARQRVLASHDRRKNYGLMVDDMVQSYRISNCETSNSN